jgi:LCP family protein required for cell wall assembly
VALNAGRSLVGVVSTVALSVTAYGWTVLGSVNDGVVTTDVIDSQVADAGPIPLDGAVDILLVGLDSRTDAYGNPLPADVLAMLHAGEDEAERNTDTMILVHIPVNGDRAVAISFPRDAYVEIAGDFGKHKLNSAFAYAYNDTVNTLLQKGQKDLKEVEEDAKVAGRKNLIATIESLIGKPGTIDRYAEVNLASFYEITKAVGGVEVCLNAPAKEPKSGIDLPAGRQTIEGAQALGFVRQRSDLLRGDLDRIVRQQVFIGALAHKLLSNGTLTDRDKLDALVAAVKKSVVLSQGWDISTFAQQMRGLSSGAIEFHTIPTLGDAKVGGADVIRVDEKQVRAFVSRMVTDDDESAAASTTTEDRPTPDETPVSQVSVEVRNGSDVKGIAASTMNTLVAKGFKAGPIGDAAEQSGSVIRYAEGDEASAKRVAAELGAPLFELLPDASLTPGYVRVILGRDYPQGLSRASTDETLGIAPKQTATPEPDVPPAAEGAAPPLSGPTVTAEGVTCVN